MIEISPSRQRRWWSLWLPFLLLSASLHALLLQLSARVIVPSRARYGTSQIAVRVADPPPPLTPPSLAPPAPPPSEPPPPPRGSARRAARVAPSHQASRLPPRPPVFGVTRSTVVEGGSGAAVQVGETLATSLDRGVRLPGWASGPTDEPRAAAPRAAPRPLRPVPLYQLDTTPAFRRKVEPVYPSLARQRGIQGTVMLKALIDATGQVQTVEVLSSPAEELATAAVAALRGSTLSPGMVQGRPVPVWLRIPYRFVLEG